MGHLGHLKEEYHDLIERLGQGTAALPEPDDERAVRGRQEILEILYTPEEAAIAARLPVRPSRLAKIAERLGMTPEALKPKLDAMCDKGVVMDLVHPETGVVRYFLSPPVVGFFEFSLMRAKDSIPKQRMAKALHDYTHYDSTFAQEVFGHETVLGRALTREALIAEESLPEVLDWQKATALIEAATEHSVSLCYCRHEAEHMGRACDAKQEVCLTLNAGASFVIRRGFGRAITKDEALQILHDSRKAGLVQIADNVQNRPTFICNCCGCCCGQLQAINEFGLAGVNPSGFEPELAADRCTGCPLCSQACPISAISMVGVRAPGQRKNVLRPEINRETCIGCGVCAQACRKDALHMARNDKPINVPTNTIEKTVRMAIERGRLAHLLVDQGESRGHRFLNQLLDAVVKLPAAERVMASEQVKSRFVREALRRVKDPTGN